MQGCRSQRQDKTHENNIWAEQGKNTFTRLSRLNSAPIHTLTFHLPHTHAHTGRGAPVFGCLSAILHWCCEAKNLCPPTPSLCWDNWYFEKSRGELEQWNGSRRGYTTGNWVIDCTLKKVYDVIIVILSTACAVWSHLGRWERFNYQQNIKYLSELNILQIFIEHFHANCKTLQFRSDIHLMILPITSNSSFSFILMCHDAEFDTVECVRFGMLSCWVFSDTSHYIYQLVARRSNRH